MSFLQKHAISSTDNKWIRKMWFIIFFKKCVYVTSVLLKKKNLCVYISYAYNFTYFYLVY